MSHRYPLVAAAITAVLGGGNAAAVIPTFLQANSPAASLVIAGSSAAEPAIASSIENTLCGGTSNVLAVTATGGTTNFHAFSCFLPTAISDPLGVGPNIAANSVVTIYYRTEGDSFVGAVPIAACHTIKRLNLADSTCTGTGLTATCTLTGTSPAAANADSWGAAAVADQVQLGVTDVEPGLLTNANYGTSFSVAAFGSASTAQLLSLAVVPLFQQVFAIAVNTSGQSFSTVNLTGASGTDILNGTLTNWNKVPDALTGAPVSTASSAITRINQVNGAGPRAAANAFFLNYECGSINSIPPGSTQSFSEDDALALANTTPGSLVLTSIDRLLLNGASYPNLVLATLNGLAPNNLFAATDAYDFWYEADFVPNPSVPTSLPSTTLSDYLQATLPDLATAPAFPSINVIPFAAADNTPTVPLTNNGQTGVHRVFVSPYTRFGNSCNKPS
jgi:hypothetical protein